MRTDVQLTLAQQAIAEVCDSLKAMLIEKNRQYGNSALEPMRVFSKASPREQLRVRMDDKLSRIVSGQADDPEDARWDLAGYLVLERALQTLELHQIMTSEFDGTNA